SSTCDINIGYACIIQFTGGGSIDAKADFLRSDRYIQRLAELFNLWQKISKIQITLILNCFLQTVEVQHNGICTSHLNDALALLHPVAVIKLDCTEIGDQRNRWRIITQYE